MGWAYVFKTYWFDAHTAMSREGTTAMTSRKDVYVTLVFYHQIWKIWLLYTRRQRNRNVHVGDLLWSLTLVVYTYV